MGRDFIAFHMETYEIETMMAGVIGKKRWGDEMLGESE
jgi:hypothetical protein